MNEEHHQARVGKLTASRYGDATAKTKTGWGASRARYQAELIAERLTGVPYPQYKSLDMQRGNEVEPQARAAYQFLTDHDVLQVGFIDHPTIAMSGFALSSCIALVKFCSAVANGSGPDGPISCGFLCHTSA